MLLIVIKSGNKGEPEDNFLVRGIEILQVF
jgi:hypothetical protein